MKIKQKTLLQSDNIFWLYVSRKKGSGLAIIEDCIDATIQRLEEYTKKSAKKGGLQYEKNSLRTKRKMTITKSRKQK